ncbi:MAG: enamine deaminase RidA (YjgF/YER057c/UK114 family) [Paracoccaceae bacterium]|jgi:enamine deaminase RidA (YjgF/YER057c/UK114 family)
MTAPFAHEMMNPKNWKAASGYANGVAAEGRLLFLGGLIGWNAQQEFETDDFVGQVDQCLQNICEVLAVAGAGPQHLVRLTWYITDKQEYLAALPEIGKAYRAHLGRNFPAMAMVQVAGLIEDRAKVEIEATAVIPKS